MTQQLRAYAVLAERGLEFISKSHIKDSQRLNVFGITGTCTHSCTETLNKSISFI